MNTCLGICSFSLSVSSECFSLFLVSCQGNSSEDCRKPVIVQAICATAACLVAVVVVVVTKVTTAHSPKKWGCISDLLDGVISILK